MIEFLKFLWVFLILMTASIQGQSSSILYVGNSIDNTVSVIDIDARISIATVKVGTRPFDVTLNPDNSRLYVANFGSSNVSVVDTNNLTVIATITIITTPHDVTFNPEGNELWVTSWNGSKVLVIDPTTNLIIHTITVGFTPRQVIFKPNENIAYVPNSVISNISIVDTQNKVVIGTITLDSCEVRQGVFTPDGAYFYCADLGHFFPTDPSGVRLIDTATQSEILVITAVGPNTDAVAFALDKRHLYIGPIDSGFISVIDTFSNTVTASISTSSGLFNASLAVDPISGLIYAPNFFLQNVSIIDPVTNTFIGTITVGRGPFSLVIPSVGALKVSVKSKKDIFLTQTDHYNKIVWDNPSNPSIVKWQIYRDLGLTNLIATLPSNETKFLDHNLKPDTSYSYTVAGINSAGSIVSLGKTVVITSS